jgi:hypothetical protein
MIDEDIEEEDAVSLRASMGVKTLEATQRLYTPRTTWGLYIGYFMIVTAKCTCLMHVLNTQTRSRCLHTLPRRHHNRVFPCFRCIVIPSALLFGRYSSHSSCR